MHRSFEEKLALYAKLAVHEGVALRKGQELLISAEIEAAPLVRLVAEEAYKAGAKNVEVFWSDPQVALARLKNGSDEAIGYAPMWLIDGITQAHRDGAARLGILSTDPGLLSAIDPQRVATYSQAQGSAKKALSDLITQSHFNWGLVGAASPGWAARVFPGVPVEEAVKKLWDSIFLTSRIYEVEPLQAWRTHSESLEQKVVWLNELGLVELRFRGPGTDLRMGLADGHIWAGGRGVSKNGVKCSPNIPTEEVFTMPHRAQVEGVVRSSMPLSVRGQLVDEICVEFKDGVAVKASAGKGEETLERLLSSDDNARRLGEVALVPNSAKVAQAGILFYNSLYDENAASHIAFGGAYGENMSGYDDLSEAEREARGANDSIIHVDWMIGSGQMDVDGVDAAGNVTALMRAGEWV